MKVEYKETNKITNQVISKVLEIQKTKGLTPENIINEARNRNSPLHSIFEWDDSKAGEKWRLQQARVFINEIKVIVDSKEYFAFENVSVSVQSPNNSEEVIESREYKPIVEIINNEDLRQQVIRSALNNLSYWEEQNAKYEELSPIISTARKVRQKLNKKWQKKK